MGLAGFNRARRRQNTGEGAVLATAPKPRGAGLHYVKQDITEKQYCAHCDKHFNNTSAYLRHMMYKHTQEFIENNPNVELPLDLKLKLENTVRQSRNDFEQNKFDGQSVEETDFAE